ncbi:MAG: type II/IV secretion system protein, partial [Candidatus Kerfeldbacteria bacterium]|nr:type II/IV secretion system protein [Candidatus Kerfeldbacteria bacterium]
GYRGRVGIYEVFTMNEEVEKLILASQVSEKHIEEIAIQHGMVTMAQDGILKALDGTTTLEEIHKAVGETR